MRIILKLFVISGVMHFLTIAFEHSMYPVMLLGSSLVLFMSVDVYKSVQKWLSGWN